MVLSLATRILSAPVRAPDTMMVMAPSLSALVFRSSTLVTVTVVPDAPPVVPPFWVQ
jgi:hypothetical protein